jgi:hypothetical protein
VPHWVVQATHGLLRILLAAHPELLSPLLHRVRDLALFDLAIDSELRACDLVKLRVRDVSHGGCVSARAIVMQQKTHRPVQFEITEVTRDAKFVTSPSSELNVSIGSRRE